MSEVITWKGGNSYQKFKDFDANAKYDIVVLGSSHAYRGYDPRIFKKYGLTLFNLGTSGQSIFNSYYIAKNYIAKNNCDLVLLDIYDGALASDGIESCADLIQNISSDKAAFQMGLHLKNPGAINMLTVRMLNTNSSPMYIDSFYVFNGYSEKRDSVLNTAKYSYTADLKVNPIQLAYLEDLLLYFKQSSINVLMVTHPTPKESNNGNHDQFNEMVSMLSKKYTIPYWDYSYSVVLDTKKDYYDSHHLNQSGVNKFDSVLINDLIKNNYIKFGKQQ
ncbi:MAG: hypothetical protein JNL69_01430 [Bacteroidia bacterium]|nr:hypothetical protein [Bacteroidia bacterium]